MLTSQLCRVRARVNSDRREEIKYVGREWQVEEVIRHVNHCMEQTCQRATTEEVIRHVNHWMQQNYKRATTEESIRHVNHCMWQSCNRVATEELYDTSTTVYNRIVTELQQNYTKSSICLSNFHPSVSFLWTTSKICDRIKNQVVSTKKTVIWRNIEDQ